MQQKDSLADGCSTRQEFVQDGWPLVAASAIAKASSRQQTAGRETMKSASLKRSERQRQAENDKATVAHSHEHIAPAAFASMKTRLYCGRSVMAPFTSLLSADALRDARRDRCRCNTAMCDLHVSQKLNKVTL